MKTKKILKIATVICFISLAFIFNACSKKKMDMKDMDVSMTKSTDPIKVNVPCTFTFMVAGSSAELAGISTPHCEVGLTGSTGTEYPASNGSMAGEYTIERTFTAVGDYDVHFLYMHDGSEMGKNFTVTVIK